MKSKQVKFQIGKNGLTEQFIESLILAFKNRKQVRISVLQNKIQTKIFAKEIEKRLPFQTKIRVLGFTIIILKQSAKTKSKV